MFIHEHVNWFKFRYNSEGFISLLAIACRLGITTSGLVNSSRSVDGVVEMMLDATQNYSGELTEEQLLGWHA